MSNVSAVKSHSYECPCCEGRGLQLSFVCCQNFTDSGCCGSPDVEDTDCTLCQGERFVSLNMYKEFAIQECREDLIAEFERLYMLEELQNLHPKLSSFKKAKAL